MKREYPSSKSKRSCFFFFISIIAKEEEKHAHICFCIKFQEEERKERKRRRRFQMGICWGSPSVNQSPNTTGQISSGTIESYVTFFSYQKLSIFFCDYIPSISSVYESSLSVFSYSNSLLVCFLMWVLFSFQQYNNSISFCCE